MLSLTVVRMVPVAISLWGTHARAPTVAFIGWFGPRGLASIVFAVIVEDAHLPHRLKASGFGELRCRVVPGSSGRVTSSLHPSVSISWDTASIRAR